MKAVDETKSKMQDTLEHFKKELGNLRTGRANPSMLDNVSVEVYGTQMRIKELANVIASDGRQLIVSPFDPQTAGSIAKGIEKANLNVRPILEGHQIRIPIPPLDESTRKEIVKQGKKKAEDTKVTIREVRRKGNETIRKKQSEGEITEDEMKRGEKKIQELTDDYCKKIDELFTAKEKEIMTI